MKKINTLKKIQFFSISVIILVMAFLCSPLTFGWFYMATVSEANATGYIIGSYFEYGDGSEEEPYGIAQPIQMYYFSWLQNLGFFNKVDDETGQIKPIYFELSDKYGSTIVMNNEEYEYVLPPIGTIVNPFVGEFNGNGVTLANVVVDNTLTEMTDYPYEYEMAGFDGTGSSSYGPQIAGLFGVVGKVEGTSVPYDDTVTALKDFHIENATIKTTRPIDDESIIGIVAGYVNCPLSGITVKDSSVQVGNGITPTTSPNLTNVSDYTLIGYCEDEYKTALNLAMVTVNGPVSTQNVLYKNTQGEGAGFGGSIQMKNLYTRLLTLYNAASTVNTAVTSETLTIDEKTGSQSITNQRTTSVSGTDYTYRVLDFDSPTGTYSFRTTNSDRYMYLTGSFDDYSKYLLTITKKTNTTDAYLISNGTYYLNLNDNSITYSNDESTATGWAIDNSGHLFTYSDTDNGRTNYNVITPEEENRFYLNATNTLTVSTTGSTVWTKDSDDTLHYTYNNHTWYLYYDNGWNVAPEKDRYKISNGNGIYLNYNNTTSVTYGNNEANATEWIIGNDGKIYCYVNNNYYYLIGDNNDQLSLSTNAASATVWTYNNNQLSYVSSNITRYLKFRNNTWYVFPYDDTNYITDGTNYLCYSNANGIYNTTNVNTSTEWIIDGNSIYTYAIVNNAYVKYYLNGTTYLSCTTSDNTLWQIDTNNHTISETYSGLTFYLSFGSKWECILENYYLIFNGDNYLSYNNGNIESSNEANATKWYYNNNQYFTFIEGNNNIYYLNGTTSLNVTTSSTTSWTYNNNLLTYTYSDRTWYLHNVGEDWQVYPSETLYTFSQSGYYLNCSNGTNISASDTLSMYSLWIIDNGLIASIYNGNIYYLTTSNGNLTMTNNLGNAKTWTFDEQRNLYYYPDNTSIKWYLIYDNVWTIKDAITFYTVRMGTHYLGLNGTNIIDVNQAASPSWIFMNNKLSVYIGDTRYYLTSNNTTLSLTTNEAGAVVLTYANNTLYYNEHYFIVYDTSASSWKVVYEYNDGSYFYVESNGTNYYLSATTSAVTQTTDKASAAHWYYDENNHHFYTIISSTNYYLVGSLEAKQTINATNLSITSNAASATVWTYSNNNLTCTISENNTDKTYSIVFDNNTFKLKNTSHTYASMMQASGHYTGYFDVTISNNNVTMNADNTTENTSALWHIYNNGSLATASGNNYGTQVQLFTIVNGLYYYITIPTTNNGALTLGTTSNTIRFYLNGGNYSFRRGANTDTRDYFINRTRNGWVGYQGYDDYAYMTINYYTYTAATFVEEEIFIDATASYITTNYDNINVTENGRLSIDQFNFSNNSVISTQDASVQRSVYNDTHNESIGNNTFSIDRSSLSRNLVFNDTTIRVVTRQITRERSNFPPDLIVPINVNSKENFSADDDSIDPTSNNTGYIVSGGNLETGDIRVSQYYIGDLTASQSASLTYDDSKLEVLTAVNTTNYPSGFYQVSDASNSSNTDKMYYIYDGNNYLSMEYNNGYKLCNHTRDQAKTWYIDANNRIYTTYWDTRQYLRYNYGLTVTTTQNSATQWTISDTQIRSGNYRLCYYNNNWTTRNNANANVSRKEVFGDYTKVEYDSLGLKRYQDARASLKETFNGQTQIHGLHFMNSVIDINNLTTMKEASINGNPYYNYEMPRDSIDFNVNRRGFLTIFAGTYFPTNTAFFSLHQITRDSNNKITSIKEISKIYEHTDQRVNDYVYQYTGESKPANAGRLAFDMEWMTNPGDDFISYAVYYFEIPVNGGEYALGSVDGKTGAYLFYLDIAANGGQTEDRDRTTITEKYRFEELSFTIPTGVQLTSDSVYDEENPYKNVLVQLASGYNGTYTMSLDENDVYTHDGSANSSVTYVGPPITSEDSSGSTYYPNGYKIKMIEHIDDLGHDTNNHDYMDLITIDTYDTSGTLSTREVTLYAGVESTDNKSTWIEVIKFTYDPTGHENIITRVTRASSYGGFNICFNESLRILSVTITDANIHVNFGDNTASTLQTSSLAEPLAANTLIEAVDLSNSDGNHETDIYKASVYGPELATYYYYFDGNATVDVTSTITFTPILEESSGTQTLAYDLTLTPSSGNITLYAKLLVSTYNVSTWKLTDTADRETIASYSVTITPTVRINNNVLTTTATKYTISAS